MERKDLVVPEQQVVISRKDDLLPLLEGKVFHVTTLQGYEKILYLNEDEYCLLETWEGWKTDQLWSQRVVPHVEVGYPGPVELSRTHGHLLVTLSAAGNEDPLTEIAAAFLLDSSR